MRYREIIASAWGFTQRNKRIIKWYSFPASILTTIAGIVYVTYQYFSFKSSKLFENWDHSFIEQAIRFIGKFMAQDTGTAMPLLIVAIVLGILYLLIPTICQGALIQLIARRRNGQEVKDIEGIKYGLLSFLRLFKYQLMMRTFSLVSIFFSATIFLRFIGFEALGLILMLFGFFALIALIINLLFTYAEFYIVIDNDGVIASISNSCYLVVSHWQMTFLIGILMLLIGVRIIVQVLMVLIVPALIILTTGYIATVTLDQVGVIIGGIVGLAVLFFTAYLSATINVFADAVWTFTFLELSTEPELSAREKTGENKEVLPDEEKSPVQKVDARAVFPPQSPPPDDDHESPTPK